MRKTTFRLFATTLLVLALKANMFSQVTLTASPTQGCAPLTVAFTINNMSNPPHRVEWHFGDGSPVLHDTMPLSTTITHVFANPGMYSNIYLDSYDANGNDMGSLYYNNSINVDGPQFYPADSACVGDMVSFCLNGGPYNSVQWNFGDGQTSSDACTSHSYTSLGLKTVTVTTTGGQCGSQPVTVTKTVKISSLVVPQPSGWTNLNNNTTCPGASINFNSNSYNAYLWNFGDGGTSTLQNPTHAYSTTGAKTVTLTVTNNCGQSGSSTMTVNITNAPQPFPNQNWFKLDASSTLSCPNSGIDFYAPSGYNMYVWNYGDGSSPDTSSDYNNHHTYGSTLGTYNASVKVFGVCGNDTTMFKAIVISNNAPFLSNNNNNNSFNVQSGTPACPNSNVWFNAPNGYVSYQWIFGDGSAPVTSTDSYNNHTYASTGNYTVALKITNSCGNDTTIYSTAVISGNAPFPNYSSFQLNVNPNPACPNSHIHLEAPWGYTNYTWNYGDNSTGTSSNSQSDHFYTATGNYTTSVTFMNGCGNDTTLFATLQVMNGVGFPNQSWFSLEKSADPVCPNDYVNFNAPDGYSNYEWSFDDGMMPVITSSNQKSYKFNGDSSSYTVSVKITNGCGSDTTLNTTIHMNGNVGFPIESNFQLHAHEEITCPNSSVYFEAPAGYSSYEWNFGDSSAIVTSTNNNYNHFYGNDITDYTVSVKITNGCNNDTTLNITIHIMNNVGFPTDSWFNVQVGPNPACPNDVVFFNAPGGYMNYLWHFGDGDSVMSNNNHANHMFTATGTYTYTVKITNACGVDTILSGTTAVSTSGTFNNYLSIEGETGTSSCPGDLMSFHLNQNGFSTYSWNFGDGDSIVTTGENIQHAFDTAGTYTISCKVTNGCGNTATIQTTVQIINNNPINDELTISSSPNPACANDFVYFTAENGQPTTNYFWNFGDNSPVDSSTGAGVKHKYLTNGTYTITVTAVNSCGMTKTFTLTQVIGGGNPPSLIGDDGKKNWGFPGSEGNDNATAGCAGDAIVFYFMGSAANNVYDFGDGNTGTATETMLVDGGDGAVPVTIIKHVFGTNGSYTIHLTITNSCGLSTTDSMTINVGGNQSVNGSMTTSPSPFTTCAPISFLAFGGATYAWNFGDGATLTSSSPTVLHTYASQGVYVASVVVTNGCGNTATYSLPVNVTGVGGPAVTLTSSFSPTCAGGNNGAADVAATGGQEPYTYLWNDANAQTTASAANLAAGLYSVTVTDNIGCASAFAVSINDAAPVVLTATSTASSCTSSTGTASVTVTSGGNAPYTYMWSNGSTASSLSNLAYGLYTVTVLDSNGCSASANVSVSEVNAPTVTLNSATPVSCNGGNDGAIDISVTGGSSYTYLWSNNATSQDLTGVTAGTYSVQVTSSSGCHAVYNTTVSEAGAIVVTTATATAPTCGNFDGDASATVTGGTAPYTYLWDSGAGSQTTAIATGLPAGTYAVTVTDANGCTGDEEISLSNSNAPDISAVVTDISCNGDTDGEIDISVSGGTSPYLYTWNVAPPQTNHQDLNTLAAGSYLVLVNDAQGCISVRSYTIAEPDQLMVSVTTTGATCNIDDGMAMATATGGTQPYIFLWSDNQTTQNADSLAVGSYTVTVSDNKGCTTSGSGAVSTFVPTPSICLVTVDEFSLNNVIYWDKTPYVNIDSFIVYREVSGGTYLPIGAVPYDSLSMLVDTARSVGPANGDPNVTSYRYKLELRDICGNLSAQSLYHNTIYIDGPSTNGTFDWNEPYEVEGQPDTLVANYVLICDTTNNASPWFQVGITSGSQASVTDIAYNLHKDHPDVQWRVKTDWNVVCEATRATVNTSRSNIKHGIPVVIGIETQNAGASVLVYPNPAKDYVIVEIPGAIQTADLKVVNAVGQIVFEQRVISDGTSKTTRKIATSDLSKGIYTILIQSDETRIIKKLVLN